MRNSLKIKLEEITYGLFYPAFFGNMIYDLINMILNNNGDLKFSLLYSHFTILILIVLFVVIDYSHLKADMNRIFHSAEIKSPAYFICDIITSFSLFISFVLFKESSYTIGIIFFGFIPWALFYYKKENANNLKYFDYYKKISTTVIIIFIGSYFIFGLRSEYYRVFIVSYLTLSLIFYGIYIFYVYPKFIRKSDEENAFKLLHKE